MYRLIVPIVDFANSTMGLRDYFEFNQTSLHGTSQSVDVVLLDTFGKPQVMVEAKRVDRRISAEQIDKYLSPGARGIVSNGLHWVLCRDGRSTLVSICADDTRAVVESAFDEIVSFIRGLDTPTEQWGSSEVSYIKSFIKPERIAKNAPATRAFNAISIAREVESFRAELARLANASELERLLLSSILEGLEHRGIAAPHLRSEFRQTRVSFFDERKTSGSTRIARLEIGKQQPDVLVLTELIDSESALTKLAAPAPHDKGPHMRRFRLSEVQQTKAFGLAMAAALVR